MPKAYPKELKEQILQMVLDGSIPITQIAKEFGISPITIHNWMKKLKSQDQTTQSQLQTNREQAKRIKELEQENYILRKAAAYFAKELPPK